VVIILRARLEIIIAFIIIIVFLISLFSYYSVTGHFIGFKMCKLSTDCGFSGYVGDLYCRENMLMQNYKTFYCEEEYCRFTLTPRVKKICRECVDSVCL